jgi:hypothetical protein
VSVTATFLDPARIPLAVMSDRERRVDAVDDASEEGTLKFVLTLIVATLIVAAAVAVLSAALIGAKSSAGRRPATATFRAYS